MLISTSPRRCDTTSLDPVSLVTVITMSYKYGSSGFQRCGLSIYIFVCTSPFGTFCSIRETTIPLSSILHEKEEVPLIVASKDKQALPSSNK